MQFSLLKMIVNLSEAACCHKVFSMQSIQKSYFFLHKTSFTSSGQTPLKRPLCLDCVTFLHEIVPLSLLSGSCKHIFSYRHYPAPFACAHVLTLSVCPCRFILHLSLFPGGGSHQSRWATLPNLSLGKVCDPAWEVRHLWLGTLGPSSTLHCKWLFPRSVGVPQPFVL